jgi:hypothetical protein
MKYLILGALLIAWLLLWYVLNSCFDFQPAIKTTTDTATKQVERQVPDRVFMAPMGADTVRDTITSIEYVQVTDTVIKRDTIRPIDTGSIISDFFAYRVIQRSYQDTNIRVSWNDTLSRNRLSGTGNFSYQYDQTTITKKIQHSGIYAGAQLHVGSNLDIAPVITYSTPGYSVTAGYAFQGQLILGYQTQIK